MEPVVRVPQMLQGVVSVAHGQCDEPPASLGRGDPERMPRGDGAELEIVSQAGRE